jgi:hypothetical protein
MKSTLEFLSLSAAVAGVALMFTGPTYELNESSPGIVSIGYISGMMDEARTSWCEKRVGCLKMAEALYFEARGEGEVGMQAVANVIMNRKQKSGRNVYDVITRPKQFSYLDRDSLAINDTESYALAKLIATRAMTGELEDITNGSTHYVAPAKLKRVPKWVKSMEKTVSINEHQFFRG